ncbi:glycosyltransferase family 4 protein [Niveispirillum fermenti]|uniref:glycosyltransferase family 4 protein n=1 Tax=Niveispirillum fermenti TaxID=1233113 RepID=UPI00404156D6
MPKPIRIAIIGNALPRRCGIATFTTDLHDALRAASPDLEVGIVAMTDRGQEYDYPDIVRLEIREAMVDDYVRAADALNSGDFDLVCVQHEFGIFGGEAGAHLLLLLKRLRIPVVTTLHTVLTDPSDQQRRVLTQVVDISSRVVVMAEMGRRLLRTIYSIPDEKIAVIPHGIPATDFQEPDGFKRKLGFVGQSVILTFGLLSPNKGLETVIDAMPSILAHQPDATYVILGATHPHLLRTEGERYREQLMERARGLGVADRVVFANRFVDHPTLVDHIAMSDVYVTPYLDAAQMTSGTLAFSFGMGKAVVSTPYWHARELLADGRGALVPFNDPQAMGKAIAGLLTDHDARNAMRRRAFECGRDMVWSRVGQRYAALFAQVRREQRPREAMPHGRPSLPFPTLPAVNLHYFLRMCDDTGLYQHAVRGVPDRSHGYCVDDNARALLLACALAGEKEEVPDLTVSRFTAFIQHAWNPDTRHFRNFMGFNREWLEARGSQDSHGRTLWALGECARCDADPDRQAWARDLFRLALPTVDGFMATRAQTFTLLGLDGYCAAQPRDRDAARMRDRLAARLVTLFKSNATQDWCWFEDGLSYDNARLSQALILAGRATGSQEMTDAGLRSLRWLAEVQTAPSGFFRPVGSQSFGDLRVPPRLFDQQPLEAAAMVAACAAAFQVEKDPFWWQEATRAFAWFHGENDQGMPMADEIGACRDGLCADGLNENRGGELVLSYLLAITDMRRMSAARTVSLAQTPTVQALRA